MSDPTTDKVSARDFGELGLQDWRVLLQGIEARFTADSYSAGGRFVAEIAEICDSQDHHAAVDLRYPGTVHVVSSTHYLGGLTGRDVALARAISSAAESQGLRSDPTESTVLEVAIDAMDIDAVRPFWQAVLGYGDGGSGDLMDPRGVGPSVWFQQMDQMRAERNRIHIDVTVPHDVAEQRLAETLAAGGRLVSDAEAPSFWVLADVEGNEACICTWQGRD